MTGSRRSLASLAVLALVAAPLTACGSDGEISLPTPSGSITFTPTRTPSLPALPTRTPSETPTDEPTEEPTESPSETPTETSSETATPSESPTSEPPESPSPTETVTVTESPTPSESPTPTETATPTPSDSPSPSEDAEADDATADDDKDPAPAWVWWLLGLALLALAVGIPLFLWLRRRNRWRSDLAAAEAELVWLARTHLPELRQKAGSPDRVAGGWEVAGEGRASAAEDHLTALEASAPDEDAATRARTLRDGVRAARLRLSGLQGLTSAEQVAGTLDAAIADLEAALNQPPAT